MERFKRQIQLPDWGKVAQDKMVSSCVLVIGAGGLGCPVLMHLVAMGIGHIGIVDGDIVEWTNLHRQVLYNECDIGKNKTEAAREKLLLMNSKVQVDVYPQFLDEKNVFSIINKYDIIVDGTDQIYTRYLVNDACIVSRKPWIYGAVYQYEGQVAFFNLEEKAGSTADYRDLFPDPTTNQGAISCNTAGVLGIVPNLLGLLMANEVVKYITGIGQPLSGRILHYDLRTNHQVVFDIPQKKDRQVNLSREKIEATDYSMICTKNVSVQDMAWTGVVGDSSRVMIVDVRDHHEQPSIQNFRHIRIPLNELNESRLLLEPFSALVFVCQSGIRSKQAMAWAQNIYPEKDVYHVEGGIQVLHQQLYHG